MVLFLLKLFLVVSEVVHLKQLLKSGPGLVFGIPTLGRPVPLDWALALKSLSPPINYNTIFQIIKGREVADARNALAAYAVAQDAKYLFFLGDDVVVPAHTLKQLIYRMEQDDTLGVVGGVYCSKCDPSAPLVFVDNGRGSYWGWKIGEFFECTGLGMDCTLIRVEAIRSLTQPLFKTVDEDQFAEGVNAAESWTEDLYFLNKLREETSYKIYCDASIICEHWDVYGGKKYGLPKDSLPMRQKGVVKDKKCLLFGAPLAFTDESFDITRFAEDEAADYRGKVNNLPFAANEFDWIVAQDMSHVTVTVALDEWIRVLKVGGKISIDFNDWTRKDTAIQWLRNKGYDVQEDGSFIELLRPIAICAGA